MSRDAAVAQNDALAAAFQRRLAAAGLARIETATAFYNVMGSRSTPPEADAYAATHEIIVAVDDLRRLRAVVDAADAAGASTVALRYSVRNQQKLYDAARKVAERNAAPEVARIAAAHGLKPGERVFSGSTFASTDTLEPGTLAPVVRSAPLPAPGSVTVRMRFSMKYELKR